MSRTPSPRKTRARRAQRGFTLVEVMAAGVILSIFVLGVSGLWRASTNQVSDLMVRQKAVFALNAEMERLTALYSYTTFGVNGPVSTTNYSGGLLPTHRLIYPLDMDDYMDGDDDNDFVTSSFSSFRDDSEFLVYVDRSYWTYNNRAYVWLDRDRNVAARLSWITNDINVVFCIGADNCSCHDFDGSSSPLFKDYCRYLTLYLEYPYRSDSDGDMTAGPGLQSLSLKTIVGRL